MDSFVANHRALLDLYREFGSDGPRPTRETVICRMDVIRQAVQTSRYARSLVSYERYLDIFCLRLADPGLKDRLTLLDEDRFDADLLRDPSCPYILIGAALSKLRAGNFGRGRHLLLRLAASRFPEHRIAQPILGDLVLRGASR